MHVHQRSFKAILLFLLVIGSLNGVSGSLAQGTGITLAQLRAAYDLDPLIQANMDGSGQTVAIVATGDVQLSDLDTFAQHYDLPLPLYKEIEVGNGRLVNSSEWTMDTEIVHAIAPKAAILIYESANILSPLILSGQYRSPLEQIVADGRASVMTMSYDTCEFALTDAQAQVLQAMTQRIHAAGITFYKGAGDNGAYWCAKDKNSPSASVLSVGAVTSDPYVTSVGGTTLNLADGLYGSEIVWSVPKKGAGTGGGLSSRWSIPDYQKPYQLTDVNPSGMRQVPDIAADADPISGFPFYCTVPGTTCHGWSNTGGDSATGPLWAGGTALVNQYLAMQLQGVAGGPFRVHGPEDFYMLETAYQAGKVSKAPFHDITQGDNLYYHAQPGYDLTTGLGTPDFYAIALDLEQLYRAKAAS